MIVTRDVGTQVQLDENTTVAEGATAMDALRTVANVSTRYGGGFVQAIEGLESRYPERKVDWFYHVNTRLADVGAASKPVQTGDRLVFDYRPWNRSMALEHVLTGLDDWPGDLEGSGFERSRYLDRQDGEAGQRLYARVHGDRLVLLDAWGVHENTLSAPWILAHAVDGRGKAPSILLVASGPEGRRLVDDLAKSSPVGVGRVVTPNGTWGVPAG